MHSSSETTFCDRVSLASRMTFVVVSCFFCCIAACDRPAHHKALASQGVQQFHLRMNAGNYHEIYEVADQRLRGAVSEQQFAALLRAVSEQLGPAGVSTLKDYVALRTGEGFDLSVGYETSFAKGSASEQFIWRIRGDMPILVAYQINSPQLQFQSAPARKPLTDR